MSDKKIDPIISELPPGRLIEMLETVDVILLGTEACELALQAIDEARRSGTVTAPLALFDREKLLQWRYEIVAELRLRLDRQPIWAMPDDATG